MQVFVQFELHLFLTICREVKIEPVFAAGLVFVFGLEDGFLHAVEGHGLRFGCGQGCSIFIHLAAVADGEGVFLSVFALYAPVFEPDVDGAIGRAARGECAGGEDGSFTVRMSVSIDELDVIGPIVIYRPIPLVAFVLLFPFGQVDGAAGHVQLFVQANFHPFLTVGREVEEEPVVAVATVFVFGLEDGFLHAVEGYGLRFGCGQGCYIFIHLAAVADGEGVFLAVFALHAPVLELDVEGAVERSTHGERAGGEDGLSTAGLAGSIDEPGAGGLIVLYRPIPLSVVLLFLFGQFDGAAGDVQVFVQLDRHPFLTIGREVEVEEVVAVALVFVFGLDDGVLHAVEGHGLCLWFGLWCSAAVVIVAVF